MDTKLERLPASVKTKLEELRDTLVLALGADLQALVVQGSAATSWPRRPTCSPCSTTTVPLVLELEPAAGVRHVELHGEVASVIAVEPGLALERGSLAEHADAARGHLQFSMRRSTSRPTSAQRSPVAIARPSMPHRGPRAPPMAPGWWLRPGLARGARDLRRVPAALGPGGARARGVRRAAEAALADDDDRG